MIIFVAFEKGHVEKVKCVGIQTLTARHCNFLVNEYTNAHTQHARPTHTQLCVFITQAYSRVSSTIGSIAIEVVPQLRLASWDTSGT